MKKIFVCFIAAFLICTNLTQAQTGKIVLNKGQQLKVVSSLKSNISQDMMGQSMETIMDVNIDKNIAVKDITGTDYTLNTTTTHIKMNMSLMGQDKKFDSDNKDDMAGELKDLGKDINKPVALILSPDGKCKAVASPEKTDAADNPMNNMMQQVLGGGVEEVATATYFMVIPQGKKAGDSWTENTGEGTSKTTWNYKWESTTENTAVIIATGKEVNNTTANTMGMDMTISMTNDITETRKVNLTSGIIENNSSTKKTNGTIEVMGQSIPISGTTTATISVQ